MRSYGVEGKRDVSTFIHRNQTAGAAHFGNLIDDRVSGSGQRQAAVFYQGRNLVARNETHEVFAVTRARHRATAIVRVGARADDGRVADAPGPFVRVAAGGSGGGKIADLVERNRADCSVPVLIADDEFFSDLTGFDFGF